MRTCDIDAICQFGCVSIAMLSGQDSSKAGAEPRLMFPMFDVLGTAASCQRSSLLMTVCICVRLRGPITLESDAEKLLKAVKVMEWR